MGPCLPASPKNCLPCRGISVLEKLVKTCPVWLQLGLGQAEAARILHREAAGVSWGLSTSWPVGRPSYKELLGLPKPLSSDSCPFLWLISFWVRVFFQDLGVGDW